ncbi:uncharacterized protein [Apostichopus japonicus]|uniref:uncharacterized protein isoform X3 n=1 Tax=Stichopus japonicus TaxID=307972 RepID=UPI003AB5542C
MEDDKAGPSNPVISQSANVVVQRLDSEFPTWNLTASVGDREAGSEIENQVTYILNDQISVLTPEQLRKIGVALQAKPSKPKTLSEGFETNETSQFNIVDVEQDEEEYLGEVLPDEIPDGSSVDPSDSGEVLEAIPGTEKDPTDNTIDAGNKSETGDEKSSKGVGKSTEHSTEEDGESNSAMVKTNLNRKLPVRTSESSKDSMKNGVGEDGEAGERSTRRSSRHESSHSSKEEKVTSPGFDVSHADHSYAGRTEAPTKVDTTPHRQSESSKREKNAGGREGSRTQSSTERRSKDRRSSEGKERGQILSKDIKEEKREKGSSAHTQKKSNRRDRKNSRGNGNSRKKDTHDGGESSEGADGRRPKRNSARNFKIEDLGLVSSEDEASQEEGGDEDTNEGGSEWSEDEDPERLWCICKKPHDSRFMICCDKCEDWFHGSCVNVTKQQGKHMEDQGLEWFCPNCKGDKNSSRKIKEESQPPPDKKKDRESRKEKKEDVKRERRDSIKREKSEDKGSSSSRRLSKDGSKEGREAKGQNVKGGEVKGEELKKEESKRKDTKGKDVKPASTISKETTDVKKRDSSDLVKKKKFTKPPLPKQLCIMTGCDSTAKPNTVYCSNRCILRHAVESLQLLHQEKWFSQGFKRDSSGDVKGRAHCEGDRVPVVEKHTNRLRTGLAAPTPEDLPSWLERHPTYEVLVPTAKKSPPIVTSPTSKTGRDSKDPWKRRESKDHKESSKERRESKDVAEKSPVKEVVTKEPKKVDSEKTVERRRSSESEGSKQSSTPQSSSEGVRQNVKKSLSDALCSRLKGATELKTTPEEATKTANIIEEALFKLHKDTGMKYKAKYRTLIFNLRDTKNKGLFRRVVQQKIDPAKLVQMSSEQLASKELAQWREREAKHSLEMIVQVEEERKEVPIIKKTHKGEIEVTEADDLSSLQVNTGRDSPLPVEMKSPGGTVTTPSSSGTTAEAVLLADTTEQHRSHLFDLNCKICTGRAAPPEEKSAGSKKAKVKRQVSKAEELERQEEEEARKLVAKRMEKRKQLVKGEKTQKTKGKKGAKKEKKSSAVVKELVARTPPGTPPQTPPTHEKPQKKVKSFWKGFLNMQDVAKFVAAAYHVSGPIDILNELFPDSLEIRGRIPFHTVWDYFNKLKSAGSTELTVLRFHVAHEEDKGLYGNLFNYFSTRERIGVVGGFEKPLIKDFYILPLPSHKPVPENILPFEGPGLSETRPHMLLGLIIIHKDKTRNTSQISPTQVQPRQQKLNKEAVHAGSKRPLPESSAKTAAKKDEEEKRYLPPVVKRVKSTDAEYVPEGQMSDPIVAQYGNVDPSKMKEEEIEPYSPSQEEREAPYDPTDVLDDLAEGNVQKASKDGGDEPYSPTNPSEQYQGDSQSTSQDTPDVDKLNQLLENVSGNITDIGVTEIATAADAASNLTQNLLSSLGDSDLSEQQQLLIQLTRQVEEAKKALLDKQIESLQSEISRATNQMASLQHTDPLADPQQLVGDPTGEEAGVLKVPADSSTSGMTPLGEEVDRAHHLREGQNIYEPTRPNFGPNMNPPPPPPPPPMGPNMPPFHWQGPGMGEPGGRPFPHPPGPQRMMDPRNNGQGWGPRGFGGP